MPTEAVSRRVLGLGLVPLVPVPLLDDVVRHRLLRASYKTLAEEAGVTLDGVTLDLLVADRRSWVREIPAKLARWPIKRLLRSFGGILLLKQCLDGSAEATLRCEMLKTALQAGLLPERAGDVRTWMDEALGARGHSALSRSALESAGALPPGGEGAASAAVHWMMQYGDAAQVLARFRELLAAGSAAAG